jgi:UTP:GlnB (protein PII) uridylyltransferase
MTRVSNTLCSALEHENFDFAVNRKSDGSKPSYLAAGIEFPTRIAMDNKAHPTYTLIDIRLDRLGLLYDILSCLDREGVSIALFRINTQDGAAIDTLHRGSINTR